MTPSKPNAAGGSESPEQVDVGERYSELLSVSSTHNGGGVEHSVGQERERERETNGQTIGGK